MATVVWLGGTTGVQQKDTLELTGTWSAGDTIVLDIGTAKLTLTTDTGTEETIADELVAMINGDDVIGSEGRSSTGPAVGEFSRLEATRSGSGTSSVVNIFGATDGEPFTLTVTETSAGAITHTANSVTPTGPYHWSNVENWLGGSLPVATDTVVFDHRAVCGVKFAINLSYTQFTLLSVTDGYGYGIGLGAINTDGLLPYDEYRNQWLESGAATHTIRGGRGFIKIDTNLVPTNMTISRPLQFSSTGEPSMMWKGNDGTHIVIEDGDVGVNSETGVTGQVATLSVTPRTGGNAIVYCGTGLTMTTLNQTGGTVYQQSNLTTMNLHGGTFWKMAGTLTTLTAYAGQTYYISTGTMTTYTGYGGSDVDFSRDARARTVTNMTLYKGSGYSDPLGTVTHTNGIDLHGCRPADLTRFEIPKHKTITLSAI